MITIFAAAALASAVSSANCTALAGFALENARITSAELVPEGSTLQVTVAGGPGADAEPMPAYCRVKILMTPTADSKINAELWLPAEDWNGRFLAVGNGGWAGSIQGYGDMQMALRRGYATAGTDTGHTAADGPNGMFALGHPEKLVDFAYRAIHEMADKSKAIITQAYGQAAEYSYFKGCSTGGRQGVMAAQRYPEDFDGIIAGALANRHIRMHVAQSYLHIFNNRNPEYANSYQYTADLINRSVLRQCDVLNDGFLNEPRQCDFKFESIECRRDAGDSSFSESCLWQHQTIETRDFYYGDITTSDGKVVFPGQVLGSPIPRLPFDFQAPNAFLFDTIRILGFQDANYNWRNFNLDRDLPLIDERVGFVDATDPDLREFEANGGKLLMYHGWQDAAITPKNTIQYYESVIQEMGPEQGDWMRLFMVPGMNHCSGGPGPYEFELLTTMESWRERDRAPEEIPARNPESGLTRPLCSYPETAAYDGSGDIKNARNWDCKAL
ncbi:MAG: tannase/feruloyl esterase family alpha/beta hydrolase [Pseudomonadota bacterium]